MGIEPTSADFQPIEYTDFPSLSCDRNVYKAASRTFTALSRPTANHKPSNYPFPLIRNS